MTVHNFRQNHWPKARHLLLQGCSAAASLRRGLKTGILYLAKAAGLFRVARRVTAKSVRILAYHGVWLGGGDFPGDAMFMKRETFESRLDRVQQLGFQVMTLSSVVRALRTGEPLVPNTVVITIDDGWYSTSRDMVPALFQRSMPATLYCDTAHLEDGYPVSHVMARYFVKLSRVKTLSAEEENLRRIAMDRTRPRQESLQAAYDFGTQLGIDVEPYKANRAFSYMTPEELREASRRGIDVQLHTHRHTMHDLSSGAIRSEIERNKEVLARVLERSPDSFQHFCYPSGLCSRGSAAVLEDFGILSSTTTSPGLTNTSSSLQLLPRFLDGENVNAIEFEAELSGFMSLVREAVTATRRLSRFGTDAEKRS